MFVYADNAATYAESSSSEDSRKAAEDADVYADAAHKDGLGCAIAATHNARINAEIARDADSIANKAVIAYKDPKYAELFAGEALTMANETTSKAAKTDAKDASGKAYRGKLADSYAASAKSFAGSTTAFAEEAQKYASEASEAARMEDMAAAYRAARAAQQAAVRARGKVAGDDSKPVAVANKTDNNVKPANNAKPVDRSQVQKYLDQINATVRFDFSSTEPKFDNKTDIAIRALCAAMKADKRVKVLITGHTDNVGSAKGNMSYGKKRAEGLKRVMVNQGAPASSIATASRGDKEPVVDNDTEEHRQQNRRAVITLR